MQCRRTNFALVIAYAYGIRLRVYRCSFLTSAVDRIRLFGVIPLSQNGVLNAQVVHVTYLIER